jgi:hypothetical protein
MLFDAIMPHKQLAIDGWPRAAETSTKAFLEKIAFFCYATAATSPIIFQLQILHLIKYECIFTVIYDGWQVRLAARRRLQILKLLDKIMCYKIFM